MPCVHARPSRFQRRFISGARLNQSLRALPERTTAFDACIQPASWLPYTFSTEASVPSGASSDGRSEAGRRSSSSLARPAAFRVERSTGDGTVEVELPVGYKTPSKFGSALNRAEVRPAVDLCGRYGHEAAADSMTTVRNVPKAVGQFRGRVVTNENVFAKKFASVICNQTATRRRPVRRESGRSQQLA